jgi:WD40 repeat protein
LIVGGGENLGICEVATRACSKKIEERALCIAISLDDELVPSAGETKVKVRDIQTGELVQVLRGHTGDISCLAFSPCGTAILSGSKDQTLKIWDLLSGDCTATLECNSMVTFVRWCGGKNLVLYGLKDGTFSVGDVLTEKLLKTIQGPSFSTWALKTSPDGLTFVYGSDDGTITIYSTQTLIPTKTFSVAERDVHPLSFSPDRDQIVYWSGGEVRMLDLEHGSTMPMFNAQLDTRSESVFLPDGSTFTSPFIREIKLWQRKGRISHYDHKPSVKPCSVRISADEQKIICGLEDGTIVVLDSHTGECMDTIERNCKVHSMDISRTTSLIIASSGEDCQLRLWDFCNPNFNATAQTDLKDPRLQFSVDGSEFIVSPWHWSDSEEDSLFMERWEICLSPLGLRCLGRERPQRLTERSELPHRISEDDQWVVDRDGSRVCWIPPEWRRWACRDFSGSTFVACLDSERMLIVDLPNVRS